jgi:negative regulator of sigma E activity
VFGISWLKLIAGAAIVMIVVAAVAWVLQPVWAGRANKAAAAHVTATLQTEKPKEAAKAAEANGKATGRIQVLEERSHARTVRIVSAPDSDVEFYAGMCERELYKADPQCGKRGGAERAH